KSLDPHELAGLALFIGVLFFAGGSAVLLVRTYERLGAPRARPDAEAAGLAAGNQRLSGLPFSGPPVVGGGDPHAVAGLLRDPALIAPDVTADQLLNFAAWLRPEQALHLESHVDRLLGRGESFTISLTSASGRYLTAEGRAIGGSAVLKLADVSGVKRDLADLAHHHHELQAEAAALRTVVETLPAPAWVRDAGRSPPRPGWGRGAGGPAPLRHPRLCPRGGSARRQQRRRCRPRASRQRDPRRSRARPRRGRPRHAARRGDRRRRAAHLRRHR